jgi:hypothetical protein
VAIFNEWLAEIAEKYLKKGSKVYLEGALQTRKWSDQGGQERYTTEIVLNRFRGELTMLDGVGDLIGRPGLCKEGLFTYVRYEAPLDQEGLQRLGLADISTPEICVMDTVDNIPDLQRIGRTFSEITVRPEHLLGFLPV